MDYIAIYAIVGLVIILGWLWFAYALGRYFGRQEQFLIDLKREHEEHRAEVLRRQEEMEADWAYYYEEQAKQQSEQTSSGPDAPKPSEPENIRPFKKASYGKRG